MDNVELKKAREARNAYHKQWNAKNADKVRERSRQWRANNPEKVREYNLRYWARCAEREAAEAQEVQQDGTSSN